MSAWVRAWLGRVAGSVAGVVAVWLAGHFGIDVSDTAKNGLSEGITLLGMFVFTVVYGLVHKKVNNVFDPADSASSTKS